MWLFTFSLNLAQKTFKIPTRYNCTYSQRDVLRGLTFISLETAYAEGGLKRLTKRLRRTNQPKTDRKAPNGDTIRLRLKQISHQEAKKLALQTQPASPISCKTQRRIQKENHRCHRPNLHSLLRQKDQPVGSWRQTQERNQLLPLLCNPTHSLVWTPIHHKSSPS